MSSLTPSRQHTARQTASTRLQSSGTRRGTRCVFGPPREAPRRGQQRLCPTHAHTRLGHGAQGRCALRQHSCAHTTPPARTRQARVDKANKSPPLAAPSHWVGLGGVHLQGNGSARIFCADGRVKTYSQHCEGRDSRERAEREPRDGRGTAEGWPRDSRGMAEGQPRDGRGTAALDRARGAGGERTVRPPQPYPSPL